MLVRGPFEIVDQNGEPVEAHRKTVALCRCGDSSIKPFCDGTHKLNGFSAPGGAPRACPRFVRVIRAWE
ncbi:MAG: CDGSH iron-sulfur domain-containing protein [Actinomycetota bacterium]|nr:CDGSH iron-sulfur domain-containing protein [Actinomycetota bacterium]